MCRVSCRLFDRQDNISNGRQAYADLISWALILEIFPISSRVHPCILSGKSRLGHGETSLPYNFRSWMPFGGIRVFEKLLFNKSIMKSFHGFSTYIIGNPYYDDIWAYGLYDWSEIYISFCENVSNVCEHARGIDIFSSEKYQRPRIMRDHRFITLISFEFF